MESSYDFLWRVHSYINDYIRLADTKALGLLAAFGALTGVLVHALGTSAGRIETLLFAASVFTAGTVMAFSLWVVFPRVRGQGPGVIYWKHITDMGSEEFHSTVGSMSVDDLIAQLANHVYQLASIATDKYNHLQSAFAIALLALPLALVTLAVL